MSLETPNRVAASAVLFFDLDPGDATVVFASNNGFASVQFIDATDPPLGAVLAMDQPVNNQEGRVLLGGDAGSAVFEVSAYITPNHFTTTTAAIDDLAPFQVAITPIDDGEEVFRLNVTVMKMTEVLAQLEGEPVTP